MTELNAAQPQWEYLTTFLSAEAQEHVEFLQSGFGRHDWPKYAPEALIPEMNALGAQGWQLVQMQPVFAGINHDILVFSSEENHHWTHTYLCVFKRPLRSR